MEEQEKYTNEFIFILSFYNLSNYVFRTSSSFDALRGRYFPGGHEGGLDTDLMLKQMAGEHMENINAR